MWYFMKNISAEQYGEGWLNLCYRLPLLAAVLADFIIISRLFLLFGHRITVEIFLVSVFNSIKKHEITGGIVYYVDSHSSKQACFTVEISNYPFSRVKFFEIGCFLLWKYPKLQFHK